MMASRVFVLLAVLYALASFDFESPALVGVCISVLRESTSLASGVEGSNTHSTLELLDDDRFIKPVTSENLYRYIKLRNELDVFLVSQSDAKESSARIGVKAGYLKDPDSLPGLAHYLEHLLFINTEKYPELDGFGKFVTLHNGYTNAYTSDTETVYEFNTDSSSFEEALSMFSEFFKSPLFDSTYTEKELMAIENEFNYRKNFQFIRSIHVVLENSDAKSLFRRFCIGNIETLRTIPESQGINVRDEVIGLFNREYSSNRMVLVLASSHTLEELASFAIQYFSDIPNKRLPVHSIYQPIQDGNLNPYRKMIKQLVLIDSLDKFTTMKLVFPMKRYMAKHLSQYRSLYLEKFISSTRPGSLSNHLLFSKLIFDSYARIEDNNLGFTNLEIGFTLTAVGERNIPNILISLFSVFKFMSVKKLPKEVYDERKRISDYSFRYGDSVSSVKESEHIISNFLEYGCKPEEVLYFDSYLSEFDPEIHQEIISQLVPENLIVFLEHFELESLIQSTDVSKFNYFCNSTSVNEIENVDYSRSDQGFESIIDSSIAMQDIKTERFIKVKYVTKPLSPCFLSLLNNADHNMASERYGITLPRLNPYLSTDFSNNLKCVDEEKVPTRLPAAIRKFLSGGCGGPSDHRTENPEAYGRYFYYPTKSINTPKSSLQIAFIFPLDLVSKGFSEFPTNTVRVNLLFRLLLELLQLLFSKSFHEIESASYSSTFRVSTFSQDLTRTNQLTFTLFGFTDRIEEIVSNVPPFMSNFASTVTLADFASKKELIMTSIKNSIANPQISTNLSQMRTRLFFNQDFSFEAMLAQLEDITFEEFTRFTNFFMRHSRLEGFLLGNLNPLQSAKIIHKFSSAFFATKPVHHAPPPASSSRTDDSYYSKFRSLLSLMTDLLLGRRNAETQDLLRVHQHLRPSPPIPGPPGSIESFQILDPLSLKRGSKVYYYHLSTSKSDINSAIKMTVGIGYNHLNNRILANILTLIISNDFFSEVRTKKQLGYVVSADYETVAGHVSGIRFTVVSSNQNVRTLAENTLDFWDEWFSPSSAKITEDSFEMARKSFIETLQDPLKNIPDIFSEFSSEISARTYEFAWRNSSIAIARNLSYSQFFAWFKTVHASSNIFMLAVQSPNSEEPSTLKSLPNYVPRGFSRFTASDSLFALKNIRTYNQWAIFNAP